MLLTQGPQADSFAYTPYRNGRRARLKEESMSMQTENTMMAEAVFGDFQDTIDLMEQAEREEAFATDPEMVATTPVCATIGTALIMC
ncbi:hypothetical protein DCC27_006670 [Auritidibacter sp. NML130574]|nr:hypothetical protein DCC27_006670 [Auritidibacter sp. NML130574]